MNVTLKRSKGRLQIEIDPEHLENFLDPAGFYNPDFLKAVQMSDKEIKKGQTKKRKSILDILNG